MATLDSVDWQSTIGQIVQLLTSGIGDVVNVVDDKGRLVARGLVRFDCAEAQAAAGCNSSQLQQDAGLSHLAGKDIIHRDEMIVF